jgi:hypothetical protein
MKPGFRVRDSGMWLSTDDADIDCAIPPRNVVGGSRELIGTCGVTFSLPCSLLVQLAYLQISRIILPPPSYPHNCLFALHLIRGLLDVFPVYQSVHDSLLFSTAYACYRGRCRMASTYFTKLSSSEFFALIGGEVGASAFLPLVARTAPPIVTLRVAMASCE